MRKLGHEVPNFDFGDLPSPKPKDPQDGQLAMGQEVIEPTPEKEIAPDLILSQDEASAVERLADQRGREAALMTVVKPRSRATRIIGYESAQRIIRDAQRNAAERAQRTKPGLDIEDTLELLRRTNVAEENSDGRSAEHAA